MIMVKVIHGKVRGKTIELDEDLGLAEGQEVEVQVKALPTPGTGGVEDRFQRLAAEWRRDVGPLSSVSKITQHPSYQAIIALGRDVVPLILRELERQPDHWFAALRALTGADPVAPEDRGRMDRMAAAWIHWGREQDLGLAAGQEVEVQVSAIPPTGTPGEGLRRSAGALADDPYWGAIMEEIYQARKRDTRRDIPE